MTCVLFFKKSPTPLFGPTIWMTAPKVKVAVINADAIVKVSAKSIPAYMAVPKRFGQPEVSHGIQK